MEECREVYRVKLYSVSEVPVTPTRHSLRSLDNSLISCADVKGAERIANGLARVTIEAFFASGSRGCRIYRSQGRRAGANVPSQDSSSRFEKRVSEIDHVENARARCAHPHNTD